jgi:ADP-heptose:LPS heptosyltransferase
MGAEKILVIKLGALGDLIQAAGAMAAIRRHHKDAHITLLTAKPYIPFAQHSGYFDDIWLDAKPRWHQPLSWLALRGKLIGGGFTRVYDLQNSDRSNLYFRLFPRAKRPEWVGTAKGASHRNDSPERTAGTAFAGHVQTLGLAGIKDVEIDDLSWVQGDETLAPEGPYALLVPGCAPQHPHKRWPAQNYAALARHLAAQGLVPVLIGAEAEKELAAEIAAAAPGALDLAGRTGLYDIAALARRAQLAVGNDTGPMHMIGPTGCRCLTLFSGAGVPRKHAPLGPRVKTLQKDNIADITPDEVIAALAAL